MLRTPRISPEVLGAGALGGYLLTPRYIPLLPVAPLLPAAAAVAAAAAVGVGLGYGLRRAYDWARASYRRGLEPAATGGQWPEGTWVPGGSNDWKVVGTGAKVEVAPIAVYPQQENLMNWYSFGPGRVPQFTLPPIVKFAGFDVFDQLTTEVYVEDTLFGQARGYWGTFSVGRWLSSSKILLTVRPSQGQGPGVPYPSAPMVRPLDPLFEPLTVPGPEVSPDPLRTPSPMPLAPSPWPELQPMGPSPFPDFRPVEPGVAPVPDPARRPIPLPPVEPLRPPGTGQAIGTDAKPVPLPPTQVVPTPAWEEVPWPDGEPIGEPAKRPPPTLIGIAAELGRLEQKVAQLGARPAPSGLDLQGLADLLQEMLDPSPQDFPAGSYELRPVCERDANGALLPARAVSWSAGEGALVELGLKVDALAQLLQISKELRQPICRGGASIDPEGDPVTVTFEEVEG